MRDELNRILATCAILFVLVVGWVLADLNGLLSTLSRGLIFAVANLILIFDTLDLVVRIWLRRLHGASSCGPSIDLGLADISNAERRAGLAPYAIVASVHDEADGLDRFCRAMQPFKDCVWLIDDASNDDTVLRLRRNGWHCLPGTANRNKPGAIAHLLRTLPAEIQSVVVLDPDCRWGAAPGHERDELERAVSDLQRCGAAAFTPRIQAHRRGWLVECQALEYELCCGLGRKSLGDLATNSGVSVYRRSALQGALLRHSLSIYAEDFENSLLLLAAGERIYYDDRLVIVTEAKRTLRGLLSQRVGWSFGAAKVMTERLREVTAVACRSPMAAYQYAFYLGISGILMLPLKLTSIGLLLFSLVAGIEDLLGSQSIGHHSWNDPLLFTLWYVKSAAVLTVACLVALPRGERLRHFLTLPFYPLYSLLQYGPMTLGYLNLLSLRLLGRRVFLDHYHSDPTTTTHHRGEPA